MDQPTTPPPVAADRGQLLETYLSERDCPCPNCGYNLRNLRSGRCPECALDIELTVRLTEPRQGALIAGLVGLATGAGFSVMLLIYWVVRMLLDRHLDSGQFLAVVSSGTVIEGVGLWLWIRSWPSLRRQPAGTRRLLVALCWVLTVINLTVFTVFIR